MSAVLQTPLAPNGRSTFLRSFGASVRPRQVLTVSQWADAERRLSSKGSAEPGRWRTLRNPPLREPMDCMSARSPVRDAVLRFPIQFGKTEVAINIVGYAIDHDPGPVMVALPAEVSMNKWIFQKLNPMLEETEAVRAKLSSTNTRDGANRREFKDFIGGQLYLEHAGSPARLKSTSVRTLIVDEFDEFAANLQSGDDPEKMLDGRTSAFPATYKRMKISTPSIKGLSRIDTAYEKSDQRRFYVPCPHCNHEQPLEWSGLVWNATATQCWYACRDCGAAIDEHHKTAMIAAGRWVPENPGAKVRGYHINALYYQIGLGPRWLTLVEEWREAQNDQAKLKTFINDRLAESWEDPAMRAVKHNIIADRAEDYRLRTAPEGVLAITAGVDTQDNRLAVQLLGFGPALLGSGLRIWTLDYIELPGDPALDDVWDALTTLLTTPIEHESGALLYIDAMANDAGGHRTEDVKAYVRSARKRGVRRPLCIFGAVPNNAPVLSKGKLVDVNRRDKLDRRGVHIHHVGTVGIKHYLYSRLSADADVAPDKRQIHFSQDLPPEWFAGLISETYNPSKNRFEKKRGARNEPLDTWVYAYAAAHHPELRLHRKTRSEWDAMAARLADAPKVSRQTILTDETNQPAPAQQPAAKPPRPARAPSTDDGFGRDDWRL